MEEIKTLTDAQVDNLNFQQILFLALNRIHAQASDPKIFCNSINVLTDILYSNLADDDIKDIENIEKDCDDLSWEGTSKVLRQRFELHRKIFHILIKGCSKKGWLESAHGEDVI